MKGCAFSTLNLSTNLKGDPSWNSSTAYKLGGQLVEMTQFRNELDRLGSLTADLDARVKCECRNAGTLQWGLF